MKTLLLILNFILLLPPVTITSPTPDPAIPAGDATLVIAACTPGDIVTIEPGSYRSYVPENGTVVLKVPAQAIDAEPYQVRDKGGAHALNGTAAIGQMLTGVCS